MGYAYFSGPAEGLELTIESPYVTRRVVTPKSNTGRGTIVESNDHVAIMRFRSSRASGSLASAYFENPSGLNNSNMSWLGAILI